MIEEWKQLKLHEITKRVKGNDGRMDLPTLTISASEGWMTQKKRFSSNIAGKEQKNYTLLQKGQLSYNHGNSKLAKYGVVYELRSYDEALVPKVYHSFSMLDNNIPFFVEKAFETKNLDRQLRRFVSSSARMDGLLNITFDNFMQVKMSLPHVNEQKKIAKLFSLIEQTINLHQRKIDQLNTLKKALLQKMLADGKHPKPILRFKGFTGNWEQRKLKEIGNATGGTSIESEFSNDGVYKVISIGSYSENSTYRDQGIRAVQSPKTLKRLLNKGDLTMILNDKTSSGNIIGRVLLIEKSKIYVYNQRTERIEVNTKKFDSQFMYSMLNASKVRNKIKKQSQGNTQIYVNWSTIANTEYKVPKIEEQQQVGIFFKKLDLLIALHQKKLNHLKSLKKSLLQTMFI